MKRIILSLISAGALVANLNPNTKRTFDFPELPNTLSGVSGLWWI